jgi:sigma-E factor negative regulatory protein RseC
MITEEGIITGTTQDMAWVKTVRSKSCDSCDSKDSCGEGGKSREMVVQVENTLNAKSGDRVVIGFGTAPMLKLSFVLYIFPVIFLIAGAVIGQTWAPAINMDESAASILAGLAGFALSFVVVRLFNNQFANKKEFKPFLVRFARKTEAQACSRA